MRTITDTNIKDQMRKFGINRYIKAEDLEYMAKTIVNINDENIAQALMLQGIMFDNYGQESEKLNNDIETYIDENIGNRKSRKRFKTFLVKKQFKSHEKTEFKLICKVVDISNRRSLGL